jgi:hypothetical protein
MLIYPFNRTCTSCKKPLKKDKIVYWKRSWMSKDIQKYTYPGRELSMDILLYCNFCGKKQLIYNILKI